jgi:hypothetical protein
MSLKGGEDACWALIVSMEAGEKLSLEQIPGGNGRDGGHPV